MAYLLDTTIVAGCLNGRPWATELVTPWMQRHEVATSIVVYAEVVEYLRGRASFLMHYARLRDLMRAIPPLFVMTAEAERYADIRRQLRPPYGPGLIGDIDTLIAATAVVRDLTLVTTDSDFLRVPDLRVQHIERHR